MENNTNENIIMKKNEQKALTKAITKHITDFMIDKINKGNIPESWDGFEIRHWLNKIVDQENIWSDRIRNKPWRKRIRDCNNTIIANNLY